MISFVMTKGCIKQAMLELRNISVRYGEHYALRQVSLRIEPGQTTVLLGSSGSGKSTVLKVLLGLIEATSGEVLAQGFGIHDKDIAAFRRTIGYMPQGGGLFPHLTLRDNISLVPRFLGWPPEQIKARIEALRELTHLHQNLMDRYPQQLSGGQRQRASLMRALVLEPPILMLDEPLGALDPINRFELQKDLKEIFSNLQKTVILVTHDLPEAEFFAEKIHLFNGGSILQSGRFEELQKQPSHSFVRQFFAAQRYSGGDI